MNNNGHPSSSSTPNKADFSDRNCPSPFENLPLEASSRFCNNSMQAEDNSESRRSVHSKLFSGRTKVVDGGPRNPSTIMDTYCCYRKCLTFFSVSEIQKIERFRTTVDYNIRRQKQIEILLSQQKWKADWKPNDVHVRISGHYVCVSAFRLLYDIR